MYYIQLCHMYHATSHHQAPVSTPYRIIPQRTAHHITKPYHMTVQYLTPTHFTAHQSQTHTNTYHATTHQHAPSHIMTNLQHSSHNTKIEHHMSYVLQHNVEVYNTFVCFCSSSCMTWITVNWQKTGCPCS